MSEVNGEGATCCSSDGEYSVMERVDSAGNVWRRVYTGGGAHLKNWLTQFIELWGRENVQTEEIDPTGFRCYREGGEKLFHVWMRRGRPGTTPDLSVE